VASQGIEQARSVQDVKSCNHQEIFPTKGEKMTTYSERELCIANDEGVIEDGFYDLLEAQDRANEIGDGEVTYRDRYDESGDWIEESDDDE